MKYRIENETEVFNDHYKIIRAEATYETFSGRSITAKRLAFYRGNSVAILIHEKDTNTLILTKQFRYPATKNNDDWILEIPAGSMEADECPLVCVKRETLEEVGYHIEQPTQIMSFYPSPGACTEKCYLFFAVVHSRDKIEKGGGLATENEDIKIIKLPVSDVANYIETKANDAKTILALQWFQLQKNA